MENFSDKSNILEVELLILPQSNLNQVAAVIDPLRAANRVLGYPGYRWRIVTKDGTSAQTTCGIPVPSDGAFEGAARRGPLFVLASYDARGPLDPMLRRQIREAGAAGRWLAGIETGAWVLAQAGMLRGVRATTHWEYLEDFADSFPDVKASNERYVVDQAKRRMSTAGSSPTLDLMLAMIRHRHGVSVAHEVARMFLYDVDRIGMIAQDEGGGHRENNLPKKTKWARPIDRRVSAAMALMETNIEEPLPIAQIAREAGLSARRLQSLFHAETGIGPIVYYTRLRLVQARKLLLETDRPIAEVAMMTGYGTAGRFARLYREQHGELPSMTRRNRNKSYGHEFEELGKDFDDEKDLAGAVSPAATNALRDEEWYTE